jgi:hypothetical protein
MAEKKKNRETNVDKQEGVVELMGSRPAFPFVSWRT